MTSNSYQDIGSKQKLTILQGDCRARLRDLPDESVHCCATSPPYFCQRCYSTAPQIWGGQSDCHHDWDEAFCKRCKAWSGELGSEPRPDLFVEHLVEIFSDVYRVLRDDGVLFLNIGDTYVSKSKKTGRNDGSRRNHWGVFGEGEFKERHAAGERKTVRMNCDLAEGNLIGIPWRVALGLQEFGWILRSEIIWHKPSPMPESVLNRPTRAHEQVFLLTKSRDYFYDAGAIREPCVSGNGKAQGIVGGKRFGGRANAKGAPSGYGTRLMVNPSSGRNTRDVWTLAAQPYKGAHCATMPLALAQRCILAGTSARGCCSGCGTPWVRAAEEPGLWLPICDCDMGVVPCTSLDLFAGAGTTLLAAATSGRNAIGIELHPDFCRQAADRIEKKSGLVVQVISDLSHVGLS